MAEPSVTSLQEAPRFRRRLCTTSGVPLADRFNFGTLIHNRVFIGGLHNSVTEADLQEKFSHYGQISEIKIIKKPEMEKGYAFITFEVPQDASKLLEQASGTRIRINGMDSKIAPAFRKPSNSDSTSSVGSSDGLGKNMIKRRGEDGRNIPIPVPMAGFKPNIPPKIDASVNQAQIAAAQNYDQQLLASSSQLQQMQMKIQQDLLTPQLANQNMSLQQSLQQSLLYNTIYNQANQVLQQTLAQTLGAPFGLPGVAAPAGLVPGAMNGALANSATSAAMNAAAMLNASSASSASPMSVFSPLGVLNSASMKDQNVFTFANPNGGTLQGPIPQATSVAQNGALNTPNEVPAMPEMSLTPHPNSGFYDNLSAPPVGSPVMMSQFGQMGPQDSHQNLHSNASTLTGCDTPAHHILNQTSQHLVTNPAHCATMTTSQCLFGAQDQGQNMTPENQHFKHHLQHQTMTPGSPFSPLVNPNMMQGSGVGYPGQLGGTAQVMTEPGHHDKIGQQVGMVPNAARSQGVPPHGVFPNASVNNQHEMRLGSASHVQGPQNGQMISPFMTDDIGTFQFNIDPDSSLEQ